MATPAYNVGRPNQQNQAGDELALAIEEYTGIVEGTIARQSIMQGWVPVRTLKGTPTASNYAVGESTLQKLVPGVTPDGTGTDFSKAQVTVDTTILARNAFPLLDEFQTVFDARSEVGKEHGKKIAKFYDQSFLIQGVKAARLTESAYSNGDAGKPAGHFGGTQIAMAAAGDELDPAKLYAKFAELFAEMEEKDVDPIAEGCIVITRPKVMSVLIQAEQVINGEYITSDGNSVKSKVFSAWGVPVKSSNNLPNTVITGHFLSNDRNDDAYDGDFSDVLALVISPRALLAAQNIPLNTKVFFDDVSKNWFVDAWLAFAVTPNRGEYAAVLEKFSV